MNEMFVKSTRFKQLCQLLLSLIVALAWKRPITKFTCPVFLMIAKDCTERLSAVALSVGRIIPRGWCLSGHVVRASSPLKCLDRDCVGRRRTETRRGKVYRSVREKPGNVVYRQRVLQTVTSLRIVSLVFRRYDLLIIANILFIYIIFTVID